MERKPFFITTHLSKSLMVHETFAARRHTCDGSQVFNSNNSTNVDTTFNLSQIDYQFLIAWEMILVFLN